MQNELARIIQERLKSAKSDLKRTFQGSKGEIPTRHFHLDNLLPEGLANDIAAQFPPPEKMRHIRSFREDKYTSKSFDTFAPILKDITFAVQAPEVIKEIEEITDIKRQQGDPHLYAGGLSLMTPGQFLNPHIDNSHDGERKLYRTLNLLLYLSPGWGIESGGHLELWDESVKRKVVIHSLFNRLVVMETNRHSWHSVSPVKGPGNRICVSNYYFSPVSPEGYEYFHITEFSARPEQKLRRILAATDNLLRRSLRTLVKGGLGKKDVYEPTPLTKR